MRLSVLLIQYEYYNTFPHRLSIFICNKHINSHYEQETKVATIHSKKKEYFTTYKRPKTIVLRPFVNNGCHFIYLYSGNTSLSSVVIVA